MRAELRAIEPNSTLDWEAFAAVESPKPWDDFGWFTLSIGPAGEAGADLFQVLIATHAATCRLKGNGRLFQGMIVESFEPDVIAKLLREHVSSLESATWRGLVDQLRGAMQWEYEGMEPV